MEGNKTYDQIAFLDKTIIFSFWFNWFIRERNYFHIYVSGNGRKTLKMISSTGVKNGRD